MQRGGCFACVSSNSHANFAAGEAIERTVLFFATPTAAFVAPFVLYLLLTQSISAFPQHYHLLYPVVVLTVAGATVWLLRGRRIIRPHRRIVPALVAGVVGIVLWIVLSSLGLEAAVATHLPSGLAPQSRVGFKPFEMLEQPRAVYAFLAMRLAGLAILVPVVEEIFWRGFLLRWLISPDWQNRRLGEFTLGSFFGVTLLFTLAHPEWLAAAVYCSLLNGLIYWRRDLWDCIVAHATSNLLLSIYVLWSENWHLW